MNTEREEIIKSIIEQIDKDLARLHNALCKAYDDNRHDDFINISKRIDKVGLLKASVEGYGISMKGFDWLVEKGKY